MYNSEFYFLEDVRKSES